MAITQAAPIFKLVGKPAPLSESTDPLATVYTKVEMTIEQAIADMQKRRAATKVKARDERINRILRESGVENPIDYLEDFEDGYVISTELLTEQATVDHLEMYCRYKGFTVDHVAKKLETSPLLSPLLVKVINQFLVEEFEVSR